MPDDTAVPADSSRPDSVVVLPPLEADPVFVDAVEEAVAGGTLTDNPDLQPERQIGGVGDFSSMYVRHRSSFALHARRFLRDSRDVDEVVQETFLRLFLAMPEIETEMQAIAFSRRTLTNLCIDRYRSDVRRPRLVDLDAQTITLPDDSTSEDPILQAEDAAIVRQALALLSPLHRAALVKREIEEKSVPVIAAELDIPEETVKHVLFRARRALRRLLAGSAVDPSVDLSFGEAVQVGVTRLGRAGSTGLKGFLIVVVGLVVSLPLLRQPTAGPGGLVGSAGTPTVTPQPPATSGPASAPVARHHQRPTHRSGGHGTVTAPRAPHVQRHTPASTGTKQPVAHRPSTAGHTGRPPLPVPVPPPGPAAPAYTVAGAYSGPAVVTVQNVGTDPLGTSTTVSTLSAATADGNLDVTQSVAVDSNLHAQSAFLSVAVPVADGQAGYVVADPAVSVAQQTDGTVVVTLAGQATLAGSSNEQTGNLTAVSATIQLDGTFSDILSEHMVLTNAPITSAQTSQPGDTSTSVTGDGQSVTTLPELAADAQKISAAAAITTLPGTTG